MISCESPLDLASTTLGKDSNAKADNEGVIAFMATDNSGDVAEYNIIILVNIFWYI